MKMIQTTAPVPPISMRAHWNKVYRHTLRLGWMLAISILVTLLVPTDSHFLSGMSIGYAMGGFLGFWMIEHIASRMRPHDWWLIWPELAEQKEAA